MAKKSSVSAPAVVAAAVLSMTPVSGSAVATLPTPPMGGRTVDVVSAKTGKTTGQLTYFGNKSARELAEEGRAAGLKGDALTLFKNKALRGDSDARNLLASAKVQSLFNAGAIADTLRETKGSATLRIVKPNDPAPKVAPAAVMAAKLKALGKTDAQILEIIAAVEAMNA